MRNAAAQVTGNCNALLINRERGWSWAKMLPFSHWREVTRSAYRMYLLHPTLGVAMELYIDFRDYDDHGDLGVYDDDFVADHDTGYFERSSIFPMCKNKCKLYGEPFCCPAKPRAVLVKEYGDDWETPKPGFKTSMLRQQQAAMVLPHYRSLRGLHKHRG